ncbi:MAG: carboxy-S-adenosyl-L-methionine synthase CmoA [Planctomycetaceae bacterium]|nr:carboxy-S-adenosyl-L-methionine synthase CmoA [Planctomycetaceae bacterium]
MTQNDRIYSLPLNRVGDFAFDDAVAAVFPDMIRRSVPGYATMLSVIGQCGARFARPETEIYDLGCSLGASTLVMREHVPTSCVIRAVDNSAAMLNRFREHLKTLPENGCPVEVCEADVRTFPIRNASLVVLNLTLQFIDPAERYDLLQRIAAGMIPGGALVLSEKISFESDDCRELMTEFHHEFKRAHGYSELEIAQKRMAIENRLRPEPISVHTERLKRAGFETVCPWFQCFNFASILAVR